MDLSEQYDKIYRFCFYRVKSREIAEDITQETFEKCLKALHGKTEIRYLYTVARNLCIDEYRKISEIPMEAIEEKESCDRPFYDIIVENLVLKEALNTLTEEDREILLLRFANDESVATISKLYGISRFSMGRRINRLLKTLRKYMEGE